MEKHYIRSNARFIVGPTGIAYDNRSGQVGDEERGSSGYNPSGYNRGSRARVDEKVDDAGKAGRRLAMILGIAALMAIPAGWPINLWLSGFILLAGSLRLVAKKLQLSNSPATSWKKWGAVIAKDASNTALSVITGLAVVWSLQLFLRWQGDFSGSMVLAWERAVAGAYDRLVSALSLTWLLVLLVVLLPLAWLWPQRKLISHLATARKWGGRFLVMLIAITSFTFFTSASVSTSERVLQAMRGGAPPGDPALGKPVDADAPAPATSGPGGVLAQASPLPMPSPTPAVSTPNHPSPSVRAESKDEFDDEDLFRKLNATAWALRLMKNPRVQPGVGEAFYRHNAAWALQVEAELMAHAAVNALSAEAGAFAELRGGNVRPSFSGVAATQTAPGEATSQPPVASRPDPAVILKARLAQLEAALNETIKSILGKTISTIVDDDLVKSFAKSLVGSLSKTALAEVFPKSDADVSKILNLTGGYYRGLREALARAAASERTTTRWTRETGRERNPRARYHHPGSVLDRDYFSRSSVWDHEERLRPHYSLQASVESEQRWRSLRSGVLEASEYDLLLKKPYSRTSQTPYYDVYGTYDGVGARYRMGLPIEATPKITWNPLTWVRALGRARIR